VRIGVSIYLGDQVEALPGTADQVSYHNLALRVLNGYGFTFGENWWPATSADEPTAHWSYLYTYYLVGIYTLFGPHPLAARIIQSILVGILQPLITLAIGRRLFGNVVGLMAAGINVFYLYFIYYSATLMTEPFYITAVLGFLYLAIVLVDQASLQDRRKLGVDFFLLTVAFGVVLGAAVLLRQLILLFIPFLFVWIWLSYERTQRKNLLPTFVISSLVLLVLILPFTIYNYARFDRFVLLNTNAGFAFFWANHPVHGTQFISAREMESYQELLPDALLHLDEAALDQALLKRGVSFVLDNPTRYVLLSLNRIPDYFMFWPLSSSRTISNISRVGSFGLLFPFMLLGVVLWIKERWINGIKDVLGSPGILLLVFVFVYSGIHILSWALIRYRLPVDAVLIVFAGYAITLLMVKVKAYLISRKFGRIKIP
jgi:4-amino-4-deoxy-L-arabinose transferase-like glycosyltransferase